MSTSALRRPQWVRVRSVEGLDGQAGRAGELSKQGALKTAPNAMCIDETGKAPIRSRWMDINQGDDLNPK